MFGRNEVVGQHLNDGRELAIAEIFPTIQGEGPYAGRSAVFIRMQGCNLRCYFCDTDFEKGSTHPLSDVLGMVMKTRESVPHAKLIVITGGEPLLQNVVPLIDALVKASFQVQIETAGTVWVPGLETYCSRGEVELVCSPKTANLHPSIRRWCQHFKYIVSRNDAVDPADGLPLHSTQRGWKGKPTRLYRATGTHNTIWLQPMDEQLSPDDYRVNLNAELCALRVMEYGYRLSLQMHKIVNVP